MSVEVIPEAVMPEVKPFSQLGINPVLLPVIAQLGYESPSPIQEQSIPVLMEGHDLLAQAQTGTGKTAAFALPVLSRLDVSLNRPQAIVIAPTRELAIQVAEAFQRYASGLKGFHVAPIYGGQDYTQQLRALKRGSHVIVGTPGRVMDHINRGSLKLDAIKTVVLDEADEMLKMGFVDDIEWILEHIPSEHQTALFSATMPTRIQNISKKYLNKPHKIQIKAKALTVDSIEQVFIRVANNQKIDLLTRVLEVEDIAAAIIFARTKNASAELAEKLQARGYSAAALNGDMSQSMREKVIGRFKKGTLDIVVATDVAARGIDVERVSHVINYDIPYDSESYVHRIGRTGRAGRTGKALLFVTPRERNLLHDIERTINKPIQEIQPPSIKQMNERRAEQLLNKVTGVIEKSKQLAPYKEMAEAMLEKTKCLPTDIVAALLYLDQQANPMPTEELVVRDEGRPGNSRNRRGSSRNGRSNAGSRGGYSRDGGSRNGSSRDGRSRNGSSRDGGSRSGSSRNGSSRDGGSRDGAPRRSSAPRDGAPRSGAPKNGTSRKRSSDFKGAGRHSSKPASSGSDSRSR